MLEEKKGRQRKKNVEISKLPKKMKKSKIQIKDDLHKKFPNLSKEQIKALEHVVGIFLDKWAARSNSKKHSATKPLKVIKILLDRKALLDKIFKS